MQKSKKGDLSLSTNAIVILILAITILGLALTFVRGLFKQAETKVAETFSATELSNPPTKDNPVTISPGILTLRQKESGKAVIAYYNADPDTRTCSVTSLGQRPTVTWLSVAASSATAQVPRDGINAWTISVASTTSNAADKGTVLASFKVDCGAGGTFTKDLILTLTM